MCIAFDSVIPLPEISDGNITRDENVHHTSVCDGTPVWAWLSQSWQTEKWDLGRTDVYPCGHPFAGGKIQKSMWSSLVCIFFFKKQSLQTHMPTPRICEGCSEGHPSGSDSPGQLETQRSRLTRSIMVKAILVRPDVSLICPLPFTSGPSVKAASPRDQFPTQHRRNVSATRSSLYPLLSSLGGRTAPDGPSAENKIFTKAHQASWGPAPGPARPCSGSNQPSLVLPQQGHDPAGRPFSLPVSGLDKHLYTYGHILEHSPSTPS